MMQSLQKGTLAGRGRGRPFTATRHTPSYFVQRCRASGNGNGNGQHHSIYPSPAETARTVVEIVSEGTLATNAADGTPIGIPVPYKLDKDCTLYLQLTQDMAQIANLSEDARCSLVVHPQTFPARAVASVTLAGSVEAVEDGDKYKLNIDKCLYFGSLDGSVQHQHVSVEDFAAAEPDVLRNAAVELIHAWNSERAEDVYRIVSDFLKVPLDEMAYAELLWVDRLGMYIRCDVIGKEPAVVRVPFIRPVLDERDARSVITMAAQLAWEHERAYKPPVPAFFANLSEEAAAAANN